MSGLVVPVGSRHDHHVGFWLRLLLERDRHLNPYRPSRTEAGSQRLLDEAHSRRMEGPLRLADDEVSAEQLEMLAGPEDPRVDEAIVHDPSPASRALGCRRHWSLRYRFPEEQSTSRTETRTRPVLRGPDETDVRAAGIRRADQHRLLTCVANAARR